MLPRRCVFRAGAMSVRLFSLGGWGFSPSVNAHAQRALAPEESFYLALAVADLFHQGEA
jgi:hypothetical protein